VLLLTLENEGLLPMKFKKIILILFAVGVLPLILIRLLSKFPHDLITYLGIGLIIPSFVLLLIAFYQLGNSFDVTPQAKELVTKGLYSKIRHPMYLFQIVLFLGLAMVSRAVITYGFCIFAIVFVIWRVRRENRILEEKFGDAYRAYHEQVWF
jgi:protein-S-isoprenylcysteine O-methyltransferase Ste14